MSILQNVCFISLIFLLQSCGTKPVITRTNDRVTTRLEYPEINTQVKKSIGDSLVYREYRIEDDFIEINKDVVFNVKDGSINKIGSCGLKAQQGSYAKKGRYAKSLNNKQIIANCYGPITVTKVGGDGEPYWNCPGESLPVYVCKDSNTNK